MRLFSFGQTAWQRLQKPFHKGGGRTQSNLRDGVALGVTAATIVTCANRVADAAQKEEKVTQCYDTIVVGGGTAGCMSSYLLAKWMQDNHIPGKVLLIDRGVSYFEPKVSPNPRIAAWYGNWAEYGEAHESVRAKDGSSYPVTASDHRGLGGCSTHDTRITFQMRKDQKQRIAKLMNWSETQLDVYYQTVLNMMPISPAFDMTAIPPFYSAVIKNLTDGSSSLKPLPAAFENEFKTEITIDTVGISSLAMYRDGADEIRWSPVFLMHDSVRPRNLEVLTNAVVQRVVFEKRDANTATSGSGSDSELIASGIEIVLQDGRRQFIALGAQSSCTKGQNTLVGTAPVGRGEVLLTAGALGNASLLQRSGIGPAKHLQSLGIEMLVDNAEVGHGVDHEEIACIYEWLPQWNDPNTKDICSGGAMGWPLMIFGSFLPLPEVQQKRLAAVTEAALGDGEHVDSSKSVAYFQAHFGAGDAEPYTSTPSIVVTPACAIPLHLKDGRGGYRVLIQSNDASKSCVVYHDEHHQDLFNMAQGVVAVTKMFQRLQQLGIVGKRVQPPFPTPPGILLPSQHEQLAELIAWIRDNHYTVFHWASTCHSGVHGRVADEQFRVRSAAVVAAAATPMHTKTENNNKVNQSKSGVIGNLRVGSAACLPEISESNPHLTITAFAVALAETVWMSHLQRYGISYSNSPNTPGALPEPVELAMARQQLQASNGKLQIRRGGEERPQLLQVAKTLTSQWDDSH